jgi:hypothetical protein
MAGSISHRSEHGTGVASASREERLEPQAAAVVRSRRLWNGACSEVTSGMPRRPSLALVGLAVVVAAAAALGCATMPAPIAPPEPPQNRNLGVTFGAAWGFATANIQRPDGTTQALTGNGDNSWGYSDATSTVLGVLVPQLVSYHGYGERGDLGGLVGWRQVGLTGRLMLDGSPGARLESLYASAKGGWDTTSGDVGGGFEHVTPVSNGFRLVARLGVSYGRRSYDVEVPEDLDVNAGHDNNFGISHLKLYRRDTRVEAALGAILDGGHVVLTIQPYWVIQTATVEDVSCVWCVAGVTLLDFSLRGGFALALTVM